MQIQFKTRNKKQLEAIKYWIDDITEEILYGGGKGGGKSYLGASLIFGDALIYPETSYFIARKELNDLRKFTIPTIHEVFKHWGLKIDDYASFNGQDNCFNLTNGSKVYLIACKEEPSDPLFERFGSMQMTRGWIEEGGEIAENAKANLWLSIGRWKNKEYNLKKKLLITANPKKGWMKRDFIVPWRDNVLPKNRRFIQALATDNTYLPEDYVESLANEKDLVRRQRLFFGDWDYEEDMNSLLHADALTDAFSNTIVKDGSKYMCVDVARKGKDSTVFSFWDGLELYKIEKFNQTSIDSIIQRIKDYASADKIPYSHIIIDEDGVGGGVVDHLFGVKGFVANSRALPTANEVRLRQSKVSGSLIPRINFKNLKSQSAFKLAELLNDHKIRFDVIDYRDEIIEDLSALLKQKDIDSEGKLSLIPKDDVKNVIARSPDVGDTIIFRMFFELQRESNLIQEHNEDVIIRQMDNFSRNERNFTSNSSK